jgi:hypothetical protein
MAAMMVEYWAAWLVVAMADLLAALLERMTVVRLVGRKVGEMVWWMAEQKAGQSVANWDEWLVAVKVARRAEPLGHW